MRLRRCIVAATTLALVATSLHPKRAGVQEALIAAAPRSRRDVRRSEAGRQLLVGSCLAKWTARSRRVSGDSWSAPGFHIRCRHRPKRLDIVRSFFAVDDEAKPSLKEIESALLMAARYGRTAVADYLLDQGVGIDAEVDGFTAANAAATSGHLDTLRMLIGRGASLERKNRYGGTSLGGALWGLLNATPDTPAESYVSVIELLGRCQAGHCASPLRAVVAGRRRVFANRRRCSGGWTLGAEWTSAIAKPSIVYRRSSSRRWTIADRRWTRRTHLNR